MSALKKLKKKAVSLRADEVLRALEMRHRGDKSLFLTEVKTGPTWTARNLRRIDALAISRSWTKPSITAYEVKVSRGDFLADEKWPDYLDYCHRLFFACPSGLIPPSELSPECGLIYVNQEGGISVRKKAPFRNIELPWTMFYHLVISHLPERRHPFFSDTREYLMAWLKDRADRQSFGFEVSNRLQEELHKIEKGRREIEEKEMRLAADMEELRELKDLLDEFGINGWRRKKELCEILRQSIPPGVIRDLKEAKLLMEKIDFEKLEGRG